MAARRGGRTRSVPVAGLVLGVAFLATSWLAGHRSGAPVEVPTSSLVDVVDTAALTVPVARPDGRSGTPGARGATAARGRASSVVNPDPRWVTRTAERTGIPAVAVRAYGRASILAARQLPTCHLGWTTLAGVGLVESAHGTVGGAALLPDGTSSRPIIGPALDGTDGVAAIRSDAAGRRWHGDESWDHAVGPMQFLSSSWERFGADADGDGVADPTDLDDAAWGAARHLCSGGVDLRRGPDWTRAVLGYNDSDAYLRSVLSAALLAARR